MATTWLPKDVFFDRQAERGEALTYDDITERFMASNVSDAEVSLDTWFSANVPLKNPLVSAAMDTVTESDMAIAMAKLGGLGVIHNAMDVDTQRREVRRVKLELNGLIEDPRTVRQSRTLESILRKCDKMRWDFRTFPVVDSDDKLIGLLTQNDFDFAESMDLRAEEVMTPMEELIVGDKNTSIDRAYKRMMKHKKKTLPLVNKKGEVTGLYLFSDVSRNVRGNNNGFNLDENGQLRVGAAVGTREDSAERVEAMLKYGLDVVVIDTSVGDSKFAIGALRELKTSFPDLDVVIGNISDADSVKKLIKAGADGIKVGQGPGAICTTRRELGGGLPQATAVFECAQAVRRVRTERRVPVCADGGIVNNGDISKAIACGADSVMVGSFLAGTDEAAAKPTTLKDGTKVVPYRGMGSEGAMRDSNDARGYGSGGELPPAQGVEALVAYKGTVRRVVSVALTQTRKSMATCNARTIDRHQRKTAIRKITPAGQREAHAHDVTVIAV